MNRREELIELSGQIINGMLSSDSSMLMKLLDRTLYNDLGKTVVGLANKMLQEIDKIETGEKNYKYEDVCSNK
jgi:hypothetical protein